MKRYKIVCDGGGFARVTTYRQTLSAAQSVKDRAFELMFQTRHRRAVIAHWEGTNWKMEEIWVWDGQRGVKYV